MAQARLSETTGDQWDEMAKLYQELTKTISQKPIAKMLESADALLPFSEATGILDNGCGPGPVMSRIINDYKVPDTCSLTCTDFSEGMVNIVKKQKEDKVKEDSQSPWSRVEAFVQNAMDLQDVQSASKSHVTAGWVYFMTPDPRKCLNESRRVLKDGGVLTCSSWKESQWEKMTWAVKDVLPDKTMSQVPAEWRESGLLKEELEAAGFKDVETFEVDTILGFERMDTFVEFLLTKLPHMQNLVKDITQPEMEEIRKRMCEMGKGMCASEPGELVGTALVAVGRK